MTTPDTSASPGPFEALQEPLHGRRLGSDELTALRSWVRNDEADVFARLPENHERLRAEIAC